DGLGGVLSLRLIDDLGLLVGLVLVGRVVSLVGLGRLLLGRLVGRTGEPVERVLLASRALGGLGLACRLHRAHLVGRVGGLHDEVDGRVVGVVGSCGLRRALQVGQVVGQLGVGHRLDVGE